MQHLRFINSPALSGPENMAIDEALGKSLAARRDFAYLRFYRWNPPTLSFGYNQRIEKLVDIDAVNNAGIGIVRRMSGGKMVFHNQELTFSLGITSELATKLLHRHPVFLELFQFAVEPLVISLCKLGIPARFADAREMQHASANSLHCYAAAAGHSIFAGDKKLIGAAGIFRGNCLTIHGSIPIQVTFPPASPFKGTGKPDEDVSMAALKDFVDQSVIARIPDFAATIYAESFKLKLCADSLNNEENHDSQQLEKKYRDIFWKSA